MMNADCILHAALEEDKDRVSVLIKMQRHQILKCLKVILIDRA
jgi:hypothetical protein